MNELEVLKKELDQLYATNTQLNNKLKLAESLKSNFISNIMNEVYNPFSAIKMMADNLVHLTEKNLNSVIPMAQTIYREAAQLDFHLKNVFTAAKIEAGLETVRGSEVEIIPLVDEALACFKIAIQDKKLQTIHHVVDRSTKAFLSDKDKILLVLVNLLSNSIKNSPDGGVITLEIGMTDECLTMSVVDEGPGIPKSEIDFVFDRFRRVSNTINSVNGGTGLGLSVVKAVVELLGGELELAGESGTQLTISIHGNVDFVVEDDELFPEDELF